MRSAESQLGRKARAKLVTGREAYAGDGFEDRALSGRLVATYNELGEVQFALKPVLTESIHSIQQFDLRAGLKLAESRVTQDQCFAGLLVL
ncbi:hypothetical protein LTR65_003358 [Meristemomyces frigidus]